jgi:D-glycero-D-manno-heptose 1,7-bisphosphate phosphatase
MKTLSTSSPRRCVFMDRDGVINENARPGEYIRTWDEFKFIPSALDWIRLFNALDYLVIVVTNQRGVALGQMTVSDLNLIHENMCGRIADLGGRIDDIFACPHAAGACDCRKPRPGLVIEAARKWNISVPDSVMIGDSSSDEALAVSCGLRFIPVRDGRIVPDLK